MADFNEDQFNDKETGENIRDSSVFYFEGNENKNRYGKHLYFDCLHDDIVNLKGVSMNERYIFFWNLGKVWKLDLESKEMTEL